LAQAGLGLKVKRLGGGGSRIRDDVQRSGRSSYNNNGTIILE